MIAPEQLHLRLGQGRAHGRHGRNPRPLAGDDVHVSFHHHQRRVGVGGRVGGDLAGFGKAVEHPALVEERRVRPVQIFGPRLGIQRPAAEREQPPAPVGDGKDYPVAEPVIGRAAVLGGNQQARVDQLGRPRALGHQIVLQRRAALGGETDAEPAPFALRQAAPVKIVPRLTPCGAAQLGLEPFAGEIQPVGQTLALFLFLDGLRIDRRQRHARLVRQPLDGFRERQLFGLHQKRDQVAVLAARKAVIKSLVVVDEERGGLFLAERRQARVLAPLAAQLHRAPDDVGQTQAALYLVEKAVVETHVASMFRNAAIRIPRFHTRPG